MENVLKYQRIQGGVEAIFTQSKVTAAAIETNYLVIGLQNGEIHVISFAGQKLHRFRTHQSAVNSISLCFDGSLQILSCSDDGKAVLIILSQDESKEAVVNIGEPIAAVAIENGNNIGRRDRSFIIGTRKGRLIYHKSALFSQKNANLFPGDGSAVNSIAWKGNYVAWADASVVRVMDISTQSAICQLHPPRGVGVEDPFPCHLFWRSENELLIGWADTCKMIRIEDGMSDVTSSTKIARTIISWQADSIICGIYPLDDDHVVYLGYTPPEEAELSEFHNFQETPENFREFTNEPEMIIASMKTGEIVSADVLPMKGVNMDGPFGYFLLSTYQCQENVADAFKWKLKNYGKTRGGDRGNAPLLFIFGSEDLVVGRIRDVNDRVRAALEQKNLKLAVDIALADRPSLRIYSFSELLAVYLTNLLDRSMFLEAATECPRLFGNDISLWNIWIEKFMDFKQLPILTPFIPLSNPRLDNVIYEEVLTYLLETNPKHFLELIKKWSKMKPAIFDHSLMLERLQGLISSPHNSLDLPPSSLNHYDFHDNDHNNHQNQVQSQNRTFYLAAQAHLYLISREFVKALNAYLQMNTAEVNHEDDPNHHQHQPSSQLSENRQIFDLIEKENLFSAVESRIINLIRLSKDLAGKLLVNNIDKLPIKSIANQLSNDKKLLHWYLHLLFTDPVTKEIYADPTEFNELHKKQIKLYAEFAPSIHDRLSKHDFHKEVIDVRSNECILERKKIFESDFISFMKSGLADLNLCMSECQNHQPTPLYPEIAFIYSVKGERRKALHLLLNEIGNVSLAIDVIEDQFDSILFVENSKRLAQRFNSTPVAPTVTNPALTNNNDNNSTSNFLQKENNSFNNNLELWNDLIAFCLERTEYLPELLDNLGVSKIDAEKVLQSLYANISIPFLKQRMIRMIQSLIFKENILMASKGILQDDALNLLCQKNHGQRRAMKIESTIRCTACLRPLSLEAGSLSLGPVDPTNAGNNNDHLKNLLPTEKNQIQVWGTRRYYTGGGVNGGSSNANNGGGSGGMHSQGYSHQGSGLVVFSNKLAFHRVCYEKIPS